MKARIEITLNGQKKTLDAHPMERLLDVLRERLGATGVKEGCGEGECGACAVIVDGQLVNSCLIPALQADGTTILSIEGIESEKGLHPIQEAFLKCGGAQCGICTPGMILASKALLDRNPNPSTTEIKTALAGNLCRCTGYMKIFDAVKEACR